MTSTTSNPSTAPGTGTIRANGVQLHHENRGTGPALLLIPGAGGDGGVFTAAATELAEHFTVITYDRRAHSRSETPRGWTRTSVDEQADDAAALLRALALAPAYVFGSSSGATITLNLALRHPDVVKAAVAHEPPKIGVLPNRDELLQAMRERAEAATARGGYREAYAEFSGWLSGSGAGSGDDKDESRERTLGNGEVWVTRELGIVDRWDIPAELAARRTVPIVLSIGSEGGTTLHQELLPAYEKAIAAIATTLNTQVVKMPGAHIPYLTHVPQFTNQLVATLDGL